MQKIDKYEDQEAEKLDGTYKEILTHIRPYVLQLTSAESVQLCRDWLEKLHNETSQRRLRNEYLLELCRQLRTGRIGGIFSKLPPSGLLLPLPKPYHTQVCNSSSISDLSSFVVRPFYSTLNNYKMSAKCRQHHRSNPLLKYRAMGTSSMGQCLDSTNASPTVHSYHRNAARKSQLKIYKHRIDTLNTFIEELQSQNEYLKKQLVEKSNHYSDNHLYSNVSQLTSDVATLKTKLLDVQKMKNLLEKNCKQVMQEYHSTVVEQFNELKDQLDEARSKYVALDSSIAMIDEKLEDIIHGKNKETEEMKNHLMERIKILYNQFEQFAQERNKELEMKDSELFQNDVKKKKDVEMLNNKIFGLEMKLDSRIKDEETLQTTLAEQYNILRDEIMNWKSEIECETQQQYENLLSKVSELKKAVAKLEKSKEKSVYDHEKKMLRVIQNKDLEIKSLQLQLQDQKNEFSTILNTKKHSEIDNIVTLLEKRYKTLLAETEASKESQTQEYLKKIAELEDQVLNLKKF
nr:protein MLP1-like isoform X1 [Megalopta genalis]